MAKVKKHSPGKMGNVLFVMTERVEDFRIIRQN